MPYFEQQDGALCAQHALNAALQGAYYTAVDLADIARQIDQAERQVTSELPPAESQNYDDSGFFSVTVGSGLALGHTRSDSPSPSSPFSGH